LRVEGLGRQVGREAGATAVYVPSNSPKGSHGGGRKHGWFPGPETDRAREGEVKQSERHLGKTK
jgi:hypothetical protein